MPRYLITLADYLMGRDAAHALSSAVRQNALVTVGRLNALLERAERDGVAPGRDEVTGTPIASGWRPAVINDRTANAAKNSAHITGEGADLQDTPGRALARWCVAHTAPACHKLSMIDELGVVGLWLEDPRWTPDWVHLQTRPPISARRVFIPSMAAPKAQALPEQLLA